MSQVNWTKGLVIDQDPDAIRDYALDFATWLEGDSLSNATLDAENCTAVVSNFTQSVVNVRVQAVQTDAKITITVVTSTGQEDQRSIEFNPVNL